MDREVETAITLARGKVLKHPHSGESWGFLGKVFVAHSYMGEAMICFRQAEKFDRENPRWPYYQCLGRIFTDVDDAISCCRRAVELCERFEPTVLGPRLQLVELLLQDGQAGEAEQVLGVAGARDPNSPPVLYWTGLLRAQRNDLQGSILLLRQLTEHPSYRKKCCEKLASLYQRVGDRDAAGVYELRARALPSDLPWPDAYDHEVRVLNVSRESRFAKANRLQKERRFDEAIGELKRLIEKKDPALDLAYVSLGNNLTLLGRYSEAEQAFQAALQFRPTDGDVQNRLASVLFSRGEELEQKAGDYEGAKSYYQRAVTRTREALRANASLPDAHLTLGLSLLGLGKREEGIRALRDCLSGSPGMVNAHLALGEALAENNHLVDARRHLQAAVRLAEKNDLRARRSLERLEKEGSKAFARRVRPSH